MAKYSKGAQKKVESAMKRMEKGKLRSGKSGNKVTNPKQAIAIGLSEARKKGAKVPARKKAAKKAVPKKKAAKKKAAKKAAPKKRAASVRNTASKKSTSTATTRTKSQDTTPATSDTQSKASGMIQTEDPMRAVDQKAFNKFTAKGDNRQHLQFSNKSKGGLKPSGKKPLWN